MKVVNHLTDRGYLKSTRGKNGGLRLNQSPEDINIGYLVRDTEPSFTIVECFDEQKQQCQSFEICGAKRIIREACCAFLEELDKYTLADVVSGKQSPIQLRVNNN